MRTLLILVAALVAVAASASAFAVSTPSSSGALTSRDSRYGRILFDGRGFVLYAFTRDLHARSRCYGSCAEHWPPYLVRHAPRAGAGVSKARIGATRRRDGRLQATYAGRPLYYYVGDRSPGQILCQDVVEFGGRWLVVGPSGRLVR